MMPERQWDGNFKNGRKSMVRPMYGVQLKDRKISTDMMLMLVWNETIDQLAIANSVPWYGHMLREGGHILTRALDFEVEGQRKAKEDMEKAG